MIPGIALPLLIAVATRPSAPVPEDPSAGLDERVAAPVFALAEDGAVLVAWEARRGGPPCVRFNRREPGPAGAWGAPRRLAGGTAGGATALEPRLVVGPGGSVVVAWLDRRAGAYDVLVAHSGDGGRTWPADGVRIESDAPGASVSATPALAADGTGRVYCAWEDVRSGDRDIYLTRSTDGGVTWEADRRVDSDAPGAAPSFHPLLAAWDDGTVVLGWWDGRAGLDDVYLRRSTDGAVTWDGPERRLDPGAPGAVASHDARFAVRGDSLAVTWTEGLGAGERVLRRVSPDRGATWATPVPAEGPAPLAGCVTGPDGTVHVLRVAHGARNDDTVLEYVREEPAGGSPSAGGRPAGTDR
jgi:hypothetical protein